MESYAKFLDKALFDGGNADYLTVFPGPAAAPAQGKMFHVFHKDDVVPTFAGAVTLRNSKARKPSEMDDQKVTFWSNLHKKNIGEIEDRHDGPVHYKEMKFRLNARGVFEILTDRIAGSSQPRPQVFAYGRAARLFK